MKRRRGGRDFQGAGLQNNQTEEREQEKKEKRRRCCLTQNLRERTTRIPWRAFFSFLGTII